MIEDYLRTRGIPYRIKPNGDVWVKREYEWVLTNEGVSYRIVDDKYIRVNK